MCDSLVGQVQLQFIRHTVLGGTHTLYISAWLFQSLGLLLGFCKGKIWSRGTVPTPGVWISSKFLPMGPQVLFSRRYGFCAWL